MIFQKMSIPPSNGNKKTPSIIQRCLGAKVLFEIISSYRPSRNPPKIRRGKWCFSGHFFLREVPC